jgi:hypothetical protein
VWSWHPDAGVKFAGSSFRRRWWLKSPVHQGDHGVTVKPLRRECRFVSGEPVVNTLACFTYIRTRGCGCHRASGIPCALVNWVHEKFLAKTRARGAARSRRCAPDAAQRAALAAWCAADPGSTYSSADRSRLCGAALKKRRTASGTRVGVRSLNCHASVGVAKPTQP